MNLDKLKELEEKATPGEWQGLFSSVTKQVVVGMRDGNAEPVTIYDETLICALRNSAKEMIETLERYKTALEMVSRYEPYSEEDYEYAYREKIGVAKEALKDPEKTPSPTKS